METDVFISYSRKDYASEDNVVIPGNIISRIKEELTKNNISFWFDEEGVYSGDSFAPIIAKNIREAKVFLFVSTQNSNASEWTCGEIVTALSYGKKIIPFRTDDSQYNDSIILHISHLDFIEYYKNPEKSLEQLIGSIKQYLDETHLEEKNEIELAQIREEMTVVQEKREKAFRELKELESYLETLDHEYRQLQTTEAALNNSINKRFKGACAGPCLIGAFDGANLTEGSRHDEEIELYENVAEPKCVIAEDVEKFCRTPGAFPVLKLFQKKKDDVYASVFAPGEVKPKSRMLVQVYLHLFDKTEKVKALARESQKNAERQDYIHLLCRLNKGDIVDAHLNIYGESLLMSKTSHIVWRGPIEKCSFDFYVPNNLNIEDLSCSIILTIKGIPIGEMRFVTKIVETPKDIESKVFAHKFKKVFVSYSHKDEATVKPFHEGLALAGIEHFFDRSYLKTGDVFPQIIREYINSADLFVLFWSKNASESEYVNKERTQALERALPAIRAGGITALSIYPMSIEPRTDLPSDMKDYFQFGNC